MSNNNNNDQLNGVEMVYPEPVRDNRGRIISGVLNPEGAKKNQTKVELIKIMEDKLLEVDTNGITKAEKLIAKILLDAYEGDVTARKIVFSYIVGLPMPQIKLPELTETLNYGQILQIIEDYDNNSRNNSEHKDSEK